MHKLKNWVNINIKRKVKKESFFDTSFTMGDNTEFIDLS